MGTDKNFEGKLQELEGAIRQGPKRKIRNESWVTPFFY
jgi:hypothetical protein